MKSLIVLIFILSSITIQTQNLNPDFISNDRMSAIDSLKLDYEKAIQNINNEEAKVIFPHDSIYKSIELQLKEDSEKKIFGKLSYKKRSELQRKLQLEKAIIKIQNTICEMSRNEKKEEFKEKMDSLKSKTLIE
jgi:hypothetical protein